jgi:hypothetical protein
MRSCPFSDPVQAVFSRGVPVLISAGLLLAGAVLFSLNDLLVELIALGFFALGTGTAVLRIREILCCRQMRRRLLDRQPELTLPRCY